MLFIVVVCCLLLFAVVRCLLLCAGVAGLCGCCLLLASVWLAVVCRYCCFVLVFVVV